MPVDAVSGAQQLPARPQSVKQITVADGLVLSKTDLAAVEAADRLIERLRHINPGARLWRGADDDLDADALLSSDGDNVERWQPADRHGHAPNDRHRHADDIR